MVDASSAVTDDRIYHISLLKSNQEQKEILDQSQMVLLVLSKVLLLDLQ